MRNRTSYRHKTVYIYMKVVAELDAKKKNQNNFLLIGRIHYSTTKRRLTDFVLA